MEPDSATGQRAGAAWAAPGSSRQELFAATVRRRCGCPSPASILGSWSRSAIGSLWLQRLNCQPQFALSGATSPCKALGSAWLASREQGSIGTSPV